MSRLSRWLRTVGRVPWHDVLAPMIATAPGIGVLRAQASNPMEHIYYSLDDRRAAKWHHYLEIYERHFARFRGQPVRLLEIGIDQGGSLQMWRRYFGERAVLHGLDINPLCRTIDDPGVVVHIGNQSDSLVLENIVQAMGGLDILIDDGSHKPRDQIKTFETLFPKISAEGIYLCEDVHTSYWRQFGGGLRRRGTFVEYSKRLLDRMHAWYSDSVWKQDDDRFPYQVRGIFFYDSVVVIEKHQKEQPFVVQVGRRGLNEPRPSLQHTS